MAKGPEKEVNGGLWKSTRDRRHPACLIDAGKHSNMGSTDRPQQVPAFSRRLGFQFSCEPLFSVKQASDL